MRSGPPDKPTIPPRPKTKMGVTACLETKEGFKKMIKLSHFLPKIDIPIHKDTTVLITDLFASEPVATTKEFIYYKQITPYFFLYKEV